MTQKNEHRDFVIVLKVLACLLITNSHCREIYPVFFLAIGGTFGNAIFFALSGYCLSNIKESFGKWMSKRTKRLFIPLIGIILISLILCKEYSLVYSNTLLQVIGYYINKYWFVFGIFLYYPIFYFTFNSQNKKKVKTIFGLYLILYCILYLFYVDKSYLSIELEGFALFKVIFYAGIFIIGGYLRLIKENIIKKIREKKMKKTRLFILLSMGIMLALTIYGAVYIAILLFNIFLNMQFIIHVTVFCFTLCLMLIVIIFFDDFIIKNKYVKKGMQLIANSTLEIYFIQITFLPLCLEYDFPINFILFWGIALIGGILYQTLLHKIQFFKKEKL